MADMLETGSAWLEGMRRAHMTRTVTYRRGADEVELSATVGRTVFDVQDGDGATIHVESRDYLITTADLVLNGSTVLPERGDVIEDDGVDYEVLPFAGEAEWRYSDPYRLTLRIHTRQVDQP